MALARKGMGQLLEAVLARSLEQHRTPGHGLPPDAGDALVGRGVEGALAGEEPRKAAQPRADADEAVHTGALDHAGHAGIELLVGQSALGNVRQDEGLAAREGHIVEVVERQRQRIEVEVVGVVDQHRIVDTLLHLEAHGHRGSCRKARRRIAHHGAEGLDQLGVAPRGGIAHDAFGHLGKTGRIDRLALGKARLNHRAQRLVVAVVDDFAGAARQLHLLVALLFEAHEILLVGIADGGEDHHVGADDALQTRHLARTRDSRLENRQLLVALEHQHREGHAQLRVVALGRAVVFHACGQLLDNPLLDDRLAVRAGDAHHRAVELRAVIGRQTLQRRNGVVDHHKTATVAFELRQAPFDEEGPNAPGLHFTHEIVRIVVGAAHGDEHRLRAELARERAAVGHHRADLRVRPVQAAAHDGGNLRKKVFHERITNNVPQPLSPILRAAGNGPGIIRPRR